MQIREGQTVYYMSFYKASLLFFIAAIASSSYAVFKSQKPRGQDRHGRVRGGRALFGACHEPLSVGIPVRNKSLNFSNTRHLYREKEAGQPCKPSRLDRQETNRRFICYSWQRTMLPRNPSVFPDMST